MPKFDVWKSAATLVTLVAIAALAGVYGLYRWIDPFPPHQFAIAAGIAGTSYDDIARRYSSVLARNGVDLVIRNYAGAAEHFAALRDRSSGVQAAITAYGFTVPEDANLLYSLGGISLSPVFIFHRGHEPIVRFGDMRGKRLSIGTPTTSLRTLLLEALRAADALDTGTQLVDLEYEASIDALIAGTIDIAAVPIDIDDPLLQRALAAPGVRLMNVAQAEAIAKEIPGLRHVVLWRGMIDLKRDQPDTDISMLAIRNRVLVRQDLHPALQYLLLEAMREVHRPAGPFNGVGDFPSEQPIDLALSPTAQAFYRTGTTLWQRYLTFWLSSLLDRVMFFVLPILVTLIPLISIAPRVYRWMRLRQVNRMHRHLGDIERQLEESAALQARASARQRLSTIESGIRSISVPRAFEPDLQRLRIHLRMVQERLLGTGTATAQERPLETGKAMPPETVPGGTGNATPP
jgi:TRAP-type uncharacterized transport system substrate-binding protein